MVEVFEMVRLMECFGDAPSSWVSIDFDFNYNI